MFFTVSVIDLLTYKNADRFKCINLKSVLLSNRTNVLVMNLADYLVPEMIKFRKQKSHLNKKVPAAVFFPQNF